MQGSKPPGRGAPDWSYQQRMLCKSGRLRGGGDVGIGTRLLASAVPGEKRELMREAREEGGEARAVRAFLQPQLFRRAALLRHL